MRTTLVSPSAATGEELRAWHALALAVARADHPADPEPSFGATRAALLPGSDLARDTWLAWDGPRAAGSLSIVWYGDENAHLAKVDVQVHPDLRRTGLATRLLRQATILARGRGCTAAVGYAAAGTPGAAFAAAMGASVAGHVNRSVLCTAEIDSAEMARFAAGAATQTRGYSLVRWADACPDDLMDALAGVLAGMNDAPTGEVDLRPIRHDHDRIRRTERAARLRGERPFVLAARCDDTGELAGITCVFTRPDQSRADQGDTTVAAAHRGRGLGIWTKAAMLTWLATEAPHVTEFQTFNSVTNTYMIAVNARLGYRVADRWEHLQMSLADQ